jgi:hypothetical protein
MLRRHSTLVLLLGVLPGAAVSAQIDAVSSMSAAQFAGDRVLKAPYSAQRRFTSLEKLADGITTRTETRGSEARDSLGRKYSEGERLWTYEDNGKSVLKSEMLYRIDDPVSNTQTNWNSSSKEVKVIHWPKSAIDATAGIRRGAFLADVPGEGVENLGVRTIQGVVAKGRRSTYKITEGHHQIGRTLSVVHETWYCPELKIIVLETNDDPRSGTWRNELVNILRGDPTVAKYHPPTDYVVREIRLPAR